MYPPLNQEETPNLDLGHLAKTTDGRLGSDSGGSAWLPGPTSDDLLAGLAVPDADVAALQGVLAAELALVRGVLRDLVLLHGLTEGSAVASPVLTADSSLPCALAHLCVVPC